MVAVWIAEGDREQDLPVGRDTEELADERAAAGYRRLRDRPKAQALRREQERCDV